jgi:site-specific DNA-methyltransferase (adenine-specific)
MDEIRKIPVNEIIILQDRYRQDMGDVTALAESIKMVGQLVPIIVSDKMVLIAGERRLRAHKHLGLDEINAIIRDRGEIDHRIVEILENLERKDFTWQEQVAAMEDLHQMMLAQFGSNWSGRKTAEKAGLSVGGVCTDLNLAEALKEAPDVFESCKTKEQALKALKKYKIDEAMAELALRKRTTDYGKRAQNIVFCGNALELIDRLPDNSVNAIISDPIFGMDVFDNRFVNRELSNLYYADQFNDTSQEFEEVMSNLIQKADRILKPDAAIVLFCAFRYAQWLIDHCRKIGFAMDQIPAIWARSANTARSNAPEKYFNRCYDFFIYGTRGTHTLVKQGTTNVLQISGINLSDRDHPTQKPIALMEELITRMCLPGHTVLDFMCGSGSTLVAALKRGCFPIGFELDKKYYDIALINVSRAIEMKDKGMVDHL